MVTYFALTYLSKFMFTKYAGNFLFICSYHLGYYQKKKKQISYRLKNNNSEMAYSHFGFCTIALWQHRIVLKHQ